MMAAIDDGGGVDDDEKTGEAVDERIAVEAKL